MLKRILLATALVAPMVFAVTFGTTTTAEAQQRQPRVIRLDEMTIEGRVQKPTAFLFLRRAQLGYELLELRRHFIDQIVRSVQREPF